jgi:hypothetical protein
MRWRASVYNLWRKLFGRYSIDDPRPIAESAPYTYFLPTENELLALSPGDLAKLVFRSHPAGLQWEAERMWVTIIQADGNLLTGTLDNIPSDMPQLKLGATISFRRSDVIDLIWNEDRSTSPPPPSARREFWDRCIVDNCVLTGESRVDYLYREEGDLAAEDDKFPDSGWRIRGTDEGILNDEVRGNSVQYAAIGVILNHDDSWLSLIDEPIGSRFIRDLETDGFVVPSDDQPSEAEDS